MLPIPQTFLLVFQTHRYSDHPFTPSIYDQGANSKTNENKKVENSIKWATVGYMWATQQQMWKDGLTIIQKSLLIETIYWQKNSTVKTKMRHSSMLIASQLLQVPVYGFRNQRRVVGEVGKDIIINI